MGKSSPPPPPDPAVTAAAQTGTNKETSLFNTNINRVNQVGPNGSSAWVLRPGADPNNPQPGDYTQTTFLSPEQQQLADAQQRISTNLAGVAESGLNRVGQAVATPFDTSNVPGLTTGLAGAGQGLTRGVDTSGLPQLAGGNGGSYGDQVKAVQDATFARMQPQLDKSREMAENRLLNSGIEKGTQAWDDAQRTLSQGENDANMQSVLAGSQEQSRLAGLDMGARSQLFGEGATNAGIGNTAQAQGFNQQGTAATFGNQASQQALQQEAYLRQLPLNELNSLRTGAQVQAPQFSGYYTGGNAGATDISGITRDAYGNAVANTNASNANSASTAASVGSALAIAASFY